MAAVHNDQSVDYGSRTLSINGVTYVADNFTVTFPTKEIPRTNELDEPSGFVLVSDFTRGTAQLQTGANTTYVAVGQTFVTNVANTTNGNYVIQSVEVNDDKTAEKKQSITFIKKTA
jgi:hypothetical protein